MPPVHTPHAERRGMHLGHGNLTGKFGYFEATLFKIIAAFFFNSNADRLITVKTNDSSTCLRSLPPLKFQKNLCLAPTGTWHHDKTRNPPKISEVIFGFSQINISSEATEALSTPNSAFIITISKLFLCTL